MYTEKRLLVDETNLAKQNQAFIKAIFFSDINNLTNTTITKVPAVRAVTAKAVESLPHGLGLKHDDYPPGFGGSAILDTYLQYIGENVFGTFQYTFKRTYTL